MPTAVSAALIEIGETLSVLQPQLAGLRDFQRLDLHADSRREIEISIEQYVRREALLIETHRLLTALVADGHPDLDAREIVQSAYADLAQNRATIEAALAQFTPNTAVELVMSAGPPEGKP